MPIQYSLLDTGIHQFIFLESTAETAKTYIEHYSALTQSKKVKSGDPLPIYRLLLDFSRTDFPPFADVVAQSVQNRQNTQIAGVQAICYFAYLSDDGDLANKLDMLMPLLLKNSYRKIFTADQDKQAIQWLLDQSPD